MPRKLSESLKKKVAGKQFYKCANKPDKSHKSLLNYKCPLWSNSNKDIQGNFDESGYEIDHIKEYSITKDDSEENLQALCKMCHSVKTKRFLRVKRVKRYSLTKYILGYLRKIKRAVYKMIKFW